MSPTETPLFEYIGGIAGTGKSFQQRLRAEQDPSCVLTATTGIAAINLGGTTINAVLRYFDTDDLRTQYEVGHLHPCLRQLAEGGQHRIILDEVSMLDGRQLDILCLCMDEVNERLKDRGIPPVGLTLVGDFCQLPPVKAPFAFESNSWNRFAECMTILTEPRRQLDQHFIDGLNALRRGEAGKALDVFTPRIERSLDPNFVGTTLMAKNDEVDRHNALRLLQCKGDPVEFFSTRSGKQRPEWKHIPEKLSLKRGALVMILANRRTSGRSTAFEYVNGDLGTLESWRKGAYGWDGQDWGDLATVRLARNGDLVEVWPVDRTVVDHDGSKNPPIMGSITYMPLRLAYATTAHKSQGLSLDKVQIALHSHFWTTPGMLYVACSRARTLEGLRIVGHPTQFLQRCTVNPKVREWIK